MAGKKLCPTTDITGLVLAGGAGRRVSRRDKCTLPWRGRPLIEHVAERIATQVNELVISCNRNREFYAAYAASLISDARGDYQGPLAGLEALADHCSTPYLLVVPCDAPQLPTDLAAKLSAPLDAHKHLQISYARCDGRDHYLCAVIRSQCLGSISPFLDSGQRAVRHWFKELISAPVEFSDPGAFLNINRMD